MSRILTILGWLSRVRIEISRNMRFASIELLNTVQVANNDAPSGQRMVQVVDKISKEPDATLQSWDSYCMNDS